MHGVLPKPEEMLHHVRVHRVPAVPAAQTGLSVRRVVWGEAAVGSGGGKCLPGTTARCSWPFSRLCF